MAPVIAEDPRPLVVHVVYRFDVGGLEKTGGVAVIEKSGANSEAHRTIDRNVWAALKVLRKP